MTGAIAIILAQTFAVSGHLTQEVWWTTKENFQHRTQAEVTFPMAYGPVALRPFFGYTIWMRHKSRIEGSFLNAEAPRVLEGRYGAELMAGSATCRAGVTFIRRSAQLVDSFNDEMLEDIEGAAFAYHNGLRAIGRCRVGPVGAMVMSRYLHRWGSVLFATNEIAEINATFDTLTLRAVANLGGERKSVAAFYGLFQVHNDISVGVGGGWLSHPWNVRSPISFGAVVMELGARR